MDQPTGKTQDKFVSKPDVKIRQKTYKVDAQRIERLKRGFLFGFSAIDLFILLAALLTVIILQLGPKILELSETQSQLTEETEKIGKPTVTDSSLNGSILPPNQATDTGKKEVVSEKVYCKSARPEVCTLECLTGPPFICGSDGKSKCSPCQACSDPQIDWYVLQSTPCQAESNPSL